MSFSSDLKIELLDIIPKNIHCRYALLAGFISINGRLIPTENGADFAVRVESDEVEDFILKLIRMTTGIADEDIVRENEKTHHRKLIIAEEDFEKELRPRLKLGSENNRVTVNDIITERSCCKKSYLRGAFLAGGSISNPEKSYHMEISVPTKTEALKLQGILNAFSPGAKVISRKDRFIVYIKDAETISNTFGIIGASKSMMEFENIRILKDLRNSINREVNCDTANMAKTANAAAKQIDDINYCLSHINPEDMPEALREMAEVRLKYPYLSLKELGDKFTPPLGKSGINHRLKKISDMADKLRKSDGI